LLEKTPDSSMARNCITSLAAAFMLLCTLGAANAQQGAQSAQPGQRQPQARPNIGDDIPQSWGGLPEGAPARPKAVLPAPPIYDIPPPRATKLLADKEQLKLEKELAAARARHQKLEDPDIAKKSEAAAAANNAAIARARKKAGNPTPKDPVKPPAR
jgi:hypothetical protein